MTITLTYKQHDKLVKKGNLWDVIERLGIKKTDSCMVDGDDEREIVTISKIKGISMPTSNNLNCEIMLEDK